MTESSNGIERVRLAFSAAGVPAEQGLGAREFGSPGGHFSNMRTFLDAALLRHSVIWAAAGTPFAVVPLTPDNLQRLTGAEWFEVE
jgi:hypothetical protein